MTPDALQQPKEAAQRRSERMRMAWTTCTPSEIVSALDSLVHFSFKYTNTNATGGIRLAADDRLALPYLSASTVGTRGLPLDYCSSTPVSRQAMALLSGRQDELYAGIPAGFVEAVGPSLKAPTNAAEVRCEIVPHRLRQILVQDESGLDVALTPLVSAGFFKLLSDRLQERYTEAEESTQSPGGASAPLLRNVRRAYLHYGGSNPLNGGKLLTSLRRPFWFAAPIEDQNIRRAQAFHYKGIELRVDPRAVKEIRKWRRRIAHTGAAATAAARTGGEKQQEMVRAVARPLISRIREAQALLARMNEYLPTYGATGAATTGDQALTSPLLPSFMRAMLDPGARYPGWKQEAAYQIYLRIIGTTFEDGGKASTVGIAENEANRVWVRAIEELL